MTLARACFASTVTALLVLGGCGDGAKSVPTTAITAATAPPTASSGPRSPSSSASSAPPAPAPKDFTLVESCSEQGAALNEYETTLEMPSGRVVVKVQRAVAGEVTVTADDVAPVLSALAAPELEAFMTANAPPTPTATSRQDPIASAWLRAHLRRPAT